MFSSTVNIQQKSVYILLQVLHYRNWDRVRLNIIKQGVMITNSAIICSDDSILNLSNEKKSRNKEIDIM